VASGRAQGWRVWLAAARPRTLPAALAPVVMGTALAAADGVLHLGAAGLALAGAVAIQIGTNYANDYFDFRKGADKDRVLGPTRATAAGLVQPSTMKRAFLLAFGIAFVAGILLVARAGWPIVWIGLASIALGILYTGGPAPLAYTGLADPVVLIFFGPVAVGGTYFVQALTWSPASLVAGVGPGLIAVALLTVNNMRDIETDRTVRKRTLAARFGRRFGRMEYALAMLGAAAVPPVLVTGYDVSMGVLAASVTLLLALPALRQVWAAREGDTLASALAGTGRALVLYGVAFAVGCLV